MKNSSKLKIVCIIHALSLGGMERVMSIILSDFSSRGEVEVSLLLIGRNREIKFPLSKDVKVYKPDFPYVDSRRNRSTWKTGRFIRKTIKEINPDKVLSFGEIWNNLVLLSLFGLKFPVFVADRSQPSKDLGKIHNWLRKKLYPGAAGLIVQTDKAKQIARENKWNKNIAVIGNPIRMISENQEIQREKIILSVGRLIPTKNIGHLIEIFLNCEKNEDWKLIIVGGNGKKMNLLEEYRAEIKERGQEDKVQLVGEQRDVDSYYIKSQIFAFTSTSEGFPNVIGEAMSAGLPVISYDCVAGPSEMIEQDVTGYLIPENDKVSFQEKLEKLMDSEDLRKELGKKGKEKIKKFHEVLISEKFFRFITK